MMKKRLNFLTISAVLLLQGVMLSASAADPHTLLIARQVSMPAQIIEHSVGVSTYTITNNFGFDLSAISFVLPNGVTLQTGSGLCSATQSLAQGKNCTLELNFSGVVGDSFDDSTFKVCSSAMHEACSRLLSGQITRVVPSIPDAPTLKSSTDQVSLIPKHTTQWTVQNNSTTVIANRISVALPSNIAADIDPSSVTSCISTPPQGNCTLSLIVKNSVKSNLRGILNIQGSNTQPLSVNYATDTPSVMGSHINFAEPGTLNLVLANNGDVDIDVKSIVMDEEMYDEIYGVKIADYSNCLFLKAGTSCNVPFTASVDAYGWTTPIVTYTAGGSTFTSYVGSVFVYPSYVMINGGKDITATTQNGTIIITNPSPFAAQNLAVTANPQDSEWLTLTPGATNPCGTALEPGATCHMDYTLSGEITDASSVITAKFSVFQSIQQNFLPKALTIGVESNPSYQHVGYQALRVTNSTPNLLTLATINATPPSSLPYIELCSTQTTGNCGAQYASTCKVGTELIANGGTCYLWYKATDASALTHSPTVSATVSVTATGISPSTASKSILFQYNYLLYVGGAFTMINLGDDSYGLASWDGTYFRLVGNLWPSQYPPGYYGPVNAVTVQGGDIYIGGAFNSPLYKHIAKWNGSTWSGVGSGLDNTVNALTVQGNYLYAGGAFTTSGTQTLNHIARWDGSNWTAVGNGLDNTVNALANQGASIYAGGAFTSGIAKWDGVSWNMMDSQVNGAVNALITQGDDVYAGGAFTSPGNHIAKWNSVAAAWSTLGTGVNDTVYSLAIQGNSVYAGGVFTKAGGLTAVDIAQWNGTQWSNFNLIYTDTPQPGQGVFALITLNGILYLGGNLYNNNCSEFELELFLVQYQANKCSTILESRYFVGVDDGAVNTFVMAPALTLA